MFTRYNVTAEEDLREAMEKVTQYHQAAQRKVLEMEASR
jgi:hypothetical protein